MRSGLAAVILFGGLISSVSATTYNVKQDGTGDYTEIQSAMDVATTGDVVIAHPGTYEETLLFYTDGIVLRSTDPSSPSIVAATIIDARLKTYGIYFMSPPSEDTAIIGLTLKNAGTGILGGGIRGRGGRARLKYNQILSCNAPGDGGGGIRNSHGLIQGNYFGGNIAFGLAPGGPGGKGGAVYECHGVIRGNVFESNSAEWGGALSGCNGLVENNLFVSNYASNYGGAISETSGTVRNNVFVRNSAEWGGAVYLLTGAFHNNVVYDNFALGGGGGLVDCRNPIRNCLIWGNTTNGVSPQCLRSDDIHYSGVHDAEVWAAACSRQDPLFVDPAAYDFHLQPNSPYIDAGQTESSYYDALAGAAESERCDIGVYGGPGGRSVVGVNYAPVIEIVSPQGLGIADADSLSVTGKAWEGVYDVDLIECRVNGGSWASATGLEDWSFTASGLVAGRNTVEARARGEQGRYSDIARVILARRPSDDTWRVDDDGGSGVFESIQSAINAAGNGESVSVADGYYPGSLYMPDSDAHVVAVNPPLLMTEPFTTAGAVVDARGIGAPLTLDPAAAAGSVVEGLALTGGWSVIAGGVIGGTSVTLTLASQATVRNCQIIHNHAPFGGGGAAAHASGLLEGNLIHANTAFANAGTWPHTTGGLYKCSGTVRGNAITSNSALGQYGVAGAMKDCDGGVIENNTITSNSSVWRGACIYQCASTIRGNTISGHVAVDGGAAICDSSGDIIGNTITGNRSIPAGGAIFQCSGAITSNTLTGNVSDHVGGAIAECDGAISGNTFTNNFAPSGGGAIAICSGPISNNEFVDNRSTYGGAVHSVTGSVTGNTFRANHATEIGGAISWSSAAVLGNTFAGNSSGLDGGAVANCDGPLHDNTFWSNRAARGGGAVAQCGGAITANRLLLNQANDYGGALHSCAGAIDGNLLRANRSGGIGGAISWSTASITSNSLALNTAGVSGGALASCDGEIRANAFGYNKALGEHGGAMHQCGGTIRHNLFSHNQAASLGGALSNCGGLIRNNLLTGNRADGPDARGGAMAWCLGQVMNNTIWNNAATAEGGGLFSCGDLLNNIIWANTAPVNAQTAFHNSLAYSCVQDWPSTVNGVIVGDPQLVSPATGDFPLQPTSPCIDTGDPAAQHNDACLPPAQGTLRNDMGAYGGPDNCWPALPPLRLGGRSMLVY